MASPVNVKFAPTIYTVSEDDGFANLTLMSDSPVDMSYTVKVITQDRNATSKYIYVRMFVCVYIGGNIKEADKDMYSMYH